MADIGAAEGQSGSGHDGDDEHGQLLRAGRLDRYDRPGNNTRIARFQIPLFAGLLCARQKLLEQIAVGFGFAFQLA